jgi:hypothetical protein
LDRENSGFFPEFPLLCRGLGEPWNACFEDHRTTDHWAQAGSIFAVE